MRITPFIIFNQLTRSLSQTLLQYSTQNDRLTSGKKINAPSDNPAGLMRAMDYRVTVNANEQYQRNIDMAENSLNSASTIMTSVYNTMTNIQKLVAKYSNASSTTDALAAAMRSGDAQQAFALRDMLRDLANSKTMDQYLFSGFKSGTKPFADGTYAYQGDSGVVNVPVNAAGATMALNVTGDDVFSDTQALATRQLSDGQWVHYSNTPGTTTMTVVINGSESDLLNPTDTFSYSNVIQMTDILGKAIGVTGNDGFGNPITLDQATARVAALSDPFIKMQEHLVEVQTDLGGRVSSLKEYSNMLSQNTTTLKDALAAIEEADPIETIAQLKQTEITLQALRDSASRVLSQSLFDFLR